MSKEIHIEACKKFKRKIRNLIKEIVVFDENNHMIFLSGGYSRVVGKLDNAVEKLNMIIEDVIGDEDEVDEEEFMKDFFADKNGENFDFEDGTVFGFGGKPE